MCDEITHIWLNSVQLKYHVNVITGMVEFSFLIKPNQKWLRSFMKSFSQADTFTRSLTVSVYPCGERAGGLHLKCKKNLLLNVEMT